MACSPSKIPPDSQSEGNGSNGDKGSEDEMIICFGSFRLSKNATLRSLPTVRQSKNDAPPVQEDATGDTQKLAASQAIKEEACCSSQPDEIDKLPASLDIERPSVQKDLNDDTQKSTVARVSMVEHNSSQSVGIYELPESLDLEWPSTGFFHQGGRLGQPSIYTTRGMNLVENHHSGQESNPLSSNTTSPFNDLNHLEVNLNGGYASSVYENSPIQILPASSMTYQSAIYHSGNHMMNGIGNFSSMMGAQFSYNDQNIIRNGGFYVNNNIAILDQDAVQQNSSLQRGSTILHMARTRDGSKLLQKYLERGNFVFTKIILNGLLESIFHLMIDDFGHHVIGLLFEKCHINLLCPIISKAYREPDTFISVSFIDKGSRLIQRLIKRLKKTSMAEIVTCILSSRSYELLTHKTGTHVIRQCFLTLGEKPNLVLYDAISNYLLELAVDPVGCISLNTCIDSITGPRRARFLEYLAAHSRFLSCDPSGNFVVQHLLDLDNESITKEILHQLQGSFEHLAQKQGGSHVVEKCMKSSARGLDLVVREILMDERTLYRLAQDMFGNYVIQTALKETKVNDKRLYQALVNALSPHYSHLLSKTSGRYVAARIRSDDLNM